jgi:hypothetical protein
VPDRSPLLQIMRKPPADPAERCDVCGAPIDADHDHLVDLHVRALRCACRACYLLFSHEGAGGGRLRAVPQRYVLLPELAAARAQLDAFALPIGLAFFMRTTPTGRITAFYPSPAGATESELPLDAWDEFVAAVPALGTLAADVEAVLIRKRDEAVEGFIVPIDASYELVGRIRRAWRGFQGGDDLWREIDEFFARTAERARQMAAA